MPAVSKSSFSDGNTCPLGPGCPFLFSVQKILEESSSDFPRPLEKKKWQDHTCVLWSSFFRGCFSSHCCFFGAACTSKPKASMSPPLDTAPAVQPQAAGVQAVENRAGPWPHTIPGPTSEGGNLCESCGVQGTGFRRKSQSSVSSFSLCGNLKACVHCLGIQGLPPCCLP